MPDIAAPATELVLELYVAIGPAVVVGPSDGGRRQFIPITGGRFVGEGLRGEVMPDGADCQLVRPDGVLEVNARRSGARQQEGIHDAILPAKGNP